MAKQTNAVDDAGLLAWARSQFAQQEAEREARGREKAIAEERQRKLSEHAAYVNAEAERELARRQWEASPAGQQAAREERERRQEEHETAQRENARHWREQEKKEAARRAFLRTPEGQEAQKEARRREVQRTAESSALDYKLKAEEEQAMAELRERHARKRADAHVQLQERFKREGLLP